MRKKLLSIILSMAMILTMIPMMGSVAYAEGELEPATQFYVVTADGSYKLYKVNDSGEVVNANDVATDLPTGVSWDNSEKAIVLNGFTGKQVRTEQSGKELRLKLVGENKLTGGYLSGEYYGIYAYSSGIRILGSSTGTLAIDINNPESTNPARAICLSNYTTRCGQVVIESGKIDIDVLTKSVFNNGIYCSQTVVTGDADLDIDIKTNATTIDRQYCFYSATEFSTTGTVVCRTQQECCGYSDNTIKGSGNYWFFGAKIADSPMGFGGSNTADDYAIYGNNESEALAILGNTSVLTETTTTAIDVAAPVTDKVATKYFEGTQYAGLVKWTPEVDRFAAFTDYAAAISLVPLPGYKLASYGTNAFSSAVPGATSATYANGVISAKYPKTGDTTLEIINTSFDLPAPVAGKNLVTSIENADCTGTVTWTKDVAVGSFSEAYPNAEYTATVKLELKDGVEKRFNGIAKDSYTVSGGTVTNEASSKEFKVVFPRTGEAKPSVTIAGTKYNDTSDFSGFNGTVSYDADRNAIVLDGYSGGYIKNNYYCNTLKLIVKGKNEIDFSTLSASWGENAGIYSEGGDISITGEDNAILNLHAENTSTNSIRGFCISNSSGKLVLDNVKVNINAVQKENTSGVATGIYADTVLKNNACVNINLDVKVYAWRSPFDEDITVSDDSCWKPVCTTISPATERSGYILFANTEIENKYAVRKYQETDNSTITVALKDVSKWDVSLEDGIASGVKPEIKGLDGLKEGTDYQVSYPEDLIHAGSKTITITGLGDFTGTKELNYSIAPGTISIAKDLDIFFEGDTTTYRYNGKVIKPIVYINNDKTHEALEQNVDYEVTYPSGMKSVGIYTVTIEGIGKYTGTVTKTYKIIPATPSIKSLTSGARKLTVKATTKPSSRGATYYQIGYKQKGTSKWKYTTTKTYYKTITKLKKGKYYYVKVRAYKKVGTKTYYGSWSKTKLSKKIK